MKKWIVFLAALMLLTSFGAVQAQDKVGIGLVIFDRDLLSVLYNQLGNFSLSGSGSGMDLSLLLPPSKFLVPLTFGNLRIEPEFGWMRYATTTKATQYVAEQKSSTNAMRIGCGVFSVKNVKKVDLYLGGRLGIVLASNSATTPDPSNNLKSIDSKTSKTHFYLGPCVGGEYMISDNFSFGGEAQLIYSIIGQPKTTVAGKEVKAANEISTSMIDTRYMFVFRWYK